MFLFLQHSSQSAYGIRFADVWTMALTRPSRKVSNDVLIQVSALIRIGGCIPSRCALTDVKHQVVFSSFVCGHEENLHPIFVWRGTKIA